MCFEKLNLKLLFLPLEKIKPSFPDGNNLLGFHSKLFHFFHLNFKFSVFSIPSFTFKRVDSNRSIYILELLRDLNHFLAVFLFNSYT